MLMFGIPMRKTNWIQTNYQYQLVVDFQLGTSSMNSNVTGQGAAAAAADGDDVNKKKMSECQTKAGNLEVF